MPGNSTPSWRPLPPARGALRPFTGAQRDGGTFTTRVTRVRARRDTHGGAEPACGRFMGTRRCRLARPEAAGVATARPLRSSHSHTPAILLVDTCASDDLH